MSHERAPALDSLISILNTLDEGVFIEDGQGLPLFWNESFANFFGIRQSDLAEFRDTLGRIGGATGDGNEEGTEFAFTTLRGERRTGVLRKKLMEFGPDSAMTCFFIKDITELRFLESMLLRAEPDEPLEALRPREIVDGGVRLVDGLLRAKGVEARIDGGASEELLGRRSQLNHIISQLVRSSVENVGKAEKPWVSVTWSTRGERIEIEVSDSGVFDAGKNAPVAAFAAHRENDLRARVCRQIVERMGGALELGDEKALFRISLPRVRSVMRV